MLPDVLLKGVLVVFFKLEVDRKDWTDVDFGFNANVSSEYLTDALADTEAKSNAAGVHLVNRLELAEQFKEFFLVSLFDSSSIISNLDFDKADFIWLKFLGLLLLRGLSILVFNTDVDVNWSILICKFERVREQV